MESREKFIDVDLGLSTLVSIRELAARGADECTWTCPIRGGRSRKIKISLFRPFLPAPNTAIKAYDAAWYLDTWYPRCGHYAKGGLIKRSIRLLKRSTFSSRISPKSSIISHLPLRTHLLIRIRSSRLNSLPPRILLPSPNGHNNRKATTSRGGGE